MAETVTWIDPSSISYALDGSGDYLAIWDSSNGIKGAFAPIVQIIEQEVPLQPGARLRQVKTTSRSIIVPVVIRAASESAFAVARRTLRFAMNPNRGPGTLQILAADGTTRQMTCYQESGFEGDESDQYRGPGYALVLLSFKALDPYWYDAAFTTTNYTSFSTQTITNTGDDQCWPIWTINGPGTNPNIINNTTGKSLILTATIVSGEQIIIDTRPGIKTVVDKPAFGPGTLRYSFLSTSSAMFPLVVGANSVVLSMSGTTGASSVTVQYKQAWDGY